MMSEANMSAIVNERFGAVTISKKTVEERISEGRALAQTLATKVPNYGYNLNAAPNRDGSKTYVTVFVNGPNNQRAGKIQFGEIGQPTFFPDDNDLPAADTFLATAEKAGVKLRIFTPREE